MLYVLQSYILLCPLPFLQRAGSAVNNALQVRKIRLLVLSPPLLIRLPGKKQ